LTKIIMGILSFIILTLSGCGTSKDMNKPRIEIIGIYRLPVTDKLFREQFEILYGYPMTDKDREQAEKQCREQLSSVVMIEVNVINRDGKFNVDDFTQPQDNIPADSWQAAYEDSYLTPDGKSLIADLWSNTPKSGDMRMVFYMHFWDPHKPLRTSYGDIMYPNVQEMPERLLRLVPYEPVD